MHTGLGTATDVPVKVSRPVASSIVNTVTVFDACPPASKNLPPGAIAK